MESLFREILATSPVLETHGLPSLDTAHPSSPSSSAWEEMMVLTKDEADLELGWGLDPIETGASMVGISAF